MSNATRTNVPPQALPAIIGERHKPVGAEVEAPGLWVERGIINQREVFSYCHFDDDFTASLGATMGVVSDMPAGGFWLYGRLVCLSTNILQGTPTNAGAPTGFQRVRLAGIDGKARRGNQNAPSIVFCGETGAWLWISRDGLKPKRMTLAAAVDAMIDHQIKSEGVV